MNYTPGVLPHPPTHPPTIATTISLLQSSIHPAFVVTNPSPNRSFLTLSLNPLPFHLTQHPYPSPLNIQFAIRSNANEQ